MYYQLLSVLFFDPLPQSIPQRSNFNSTPAVSRKIRLSERWFGRCYDQDLRSGRIWFLHPWGEKNPKRPKAYWWSGTPTLPTTFGFNLLDDFLGIEFGRLVENWFLHHWRFLCQETPWWGSLWLWEAGVGAIWRHGQNMNSSRSNLSPPARSQVSRGGHRGLFFFLENETWIVDDHGMIHGKSTYVIVL